MIVYQRIENFDVDLFEVHKNLGRISFEDLEDFFAIFDSSHCLLPEYVLSMLETLHARRASWPLLLSKTARDELIEKLEKETQELLCIPKNVEYLKNWLKYKVFLDSMSPVKVDSLGWRKFAQQHNLTQKSAYDLRDSYLKKPIYTTSKSSTGRLSITQGPNFLVLPVSFKSLIQAPAGMSIWEIDFRTMEPRVLLSINGEFLLPRNKDVYEDVAENLGISDRSHAKTAVLSALYGSGPKNLSHEVGSLKKAKSMIESVHQYFLIDKMHQKFDREIEKEGLMRNYFGRPLYTASVNSRLRVNHYVQSTAAELSIFKFQEIVESLAAIPYAIIHDALILAVDNSKIKDLEELCNNIEFLGFPMPIKYTCLDN